MKQSAKEIIDGILSVVIVGTLLVCLAWSVILIGAIADNTRDINISLSNIDQCLIDISHKDKCDEAY